MIFLGASSGRSVSRFWRFAASAVRFLHLAAAARSGGHSGQQEGTSEGVRTLIWLAELWSRSIESGARASSVILQRWLCCSSPGSTATGRTRSSIESRLRASPSGSVGSAAGSCASVSAAASVCPSVGSVFAVLRGASSAGYSCPPSAVSTLCALLCARLRGSGPTLLLAIVPEPFLRSSFSGPRFFHGEIGEVCACVELASFAWLFAWRDLSALSRPGRTQKEPRRSPKLFFLRTEKSQGNTLKASTNIRWMRRNSDERAAASAGSWRCCRPGVPEGGETAASRSIEGGLPILLLQWSHMLRLTSEGRLRRSASSSAFHRGLPGIGPGVLFSCSDARRWTTASEQLSPASCAGPAPRRLRFAPRSLAALPLLPVRPTASDPLRAGGFPGYFRAPAKLWLVRGLQELRNIGTALAVFYQLRPV